jgi:hypothetical protein
MYLSTPKDLLVYNLRDWIDTKTATTSFNLYWVVATTFRTPTARTTSKQRLQQSNKKSN